MSKKMTLKELLEKKKEVVDIVDFIKHKYCIYENPDEGICELEIGAVIEDAISFDSDFEVFISELKITNLYFDSADSLSYAYTSLPGINKGENIFFFSDGDVTIAVPTVTLENRHGEDLGEEDFMLFNRMVEVDNNILDECDSCHTTYLRDCLINIDPSLSIEDNIKDEYIGFDGMVCENCYNKMKK